MFGVANQCLTSSHLCVMFGKMLTDLIHLCEGFPNSQNNVVVLF